VIPTYIYKSGSLHKATYTTRWSFGYRLCLFFKGHNSHILDEKKKALQSKSEKCILVGYSEDIKGYRLIQPHCNETIIRRDVKFDENILACEPNLRLFLLRPVSHLQCLCLISFLLSHLDFLSSSVGVVSLPR